MNSCEKFNHEKEDMLNWNQHLRYYHVMVQNRLQKHKKSSIKHRTKLEKLDHNCTPPEAQNQQKVHHRHEASTKCTRNIDSIYMEGPVLDIQILQYKVGSFGLLKERIAGRDDYGPL